MSDYTIPASSTCLSATQAIQKIANPFFKATGFNFFSYARDFDVNKSISLQTNPDLYLAWFENKSPYCSASIQNGVYSWDDIQNDGLIEGTRVLGHDNGIYVFKRHETYSEVFGLSSPLDSFNNLQFYVNNMSLINKFFLYFKDQAAKIIKSAISDPVELPEYMLSQPLDDEKHNQALDDLHQSLDIKKYYFDDKYDGIRFSNREKECIVYYLKGKSTSEIANILNLKKVTVDTYMRNIKFKFNCTSRSQLYEVLWKLDIFKTNGVF